MSKFSKSALFHQRAMLMKYFLGERWYCFQGDRLKCLKAFLPFFKQLKEFNCCMVLCQDKYPGDLFWKTNCEAEKLKKCRISFHIFPSLAGGRSDQNTPCVSVLFPPSHSFAPWTDPQFPWRQPGTTHHTFQIYNPAPPTSLSLQFAKIILAKHAFSTSLFSSSEGDTFCCS